jgi:hypothetical protein
MTALHNSYAWTGAPLVQDAVAERCNVAAAYAIAAANLAAAGDTPGMVHSLACASRAILAATEAAATLRPTPMEAPR